MKINLDIDENERQRILEMHNSVKSVLTEQVSTTVMTYSNDSKPARLFILNEFKLGNKFNPNYSAMTKEEKTKEIENAKIKLASMDMNELVNKARTAGVPEQSITALQQDLVYISGKPELKFISNNIPKDFVDGKLGTNTVAAYLDHQLYMQKLPEYKGPKPTTTTQFDKGSGQGSIQGTYQIGKD
jgi:hypothetical protein